jgi:hypothetical protein
MEPGIFIPQNFLTQPFNPESLGYKTGDLFSFIYIFSELNKLEYEKKRAVEGYIGELFKVAKIGALFLFIDQCRATEEEATLANWIFEIADKCPGIKNINSSVAGSTEGEGAKKYFQKGCYGLPFDEEKTDLKQYFTKVWCPRIETFCFWSVYQKVEASVQERLVRSLEEPEPEVSPKKVRV